MERKFYVILIGVRDGKEDNLKFFILKNFKYPLSSRAGWIVDIACKESDGFLISRMAIK